jgi:hypothetical protein
MEFTWFLSCYRSDDEEEDDDDDEQRKEYCVLKPHYVKKIGEFSKLKDVKIQNVLIMTAADQ